MRNTTTAREIEIAITVPMGVSAVRGDEGSVAMAIIG